MPYDQLLKELLRTFFADFLQRYFPDAAAQLDLGRISFLEQETATDLGTGRRRELDLVAQVATRGGALELILAHVELQARPELDFPERFFEYYSLLRRRHRLPVLPIVVYVTRGRGSERWEEYREETLGELTVLFRFRRLRLRALEAREEIESGDPLACALAALMDRRGEDPAQIKADSLQRIGQSGLDEARQWLLANFVDTYLRLAPDEEQRYRRLLTEEDYSMARQIDYRAWRDQAIQEGRQEGRQEGLLQAKREDILAVLRARFRVEGDDWARQVERIQTLEALDALLVRVAAANSLDEARSALTG